MASGSVIDSSCLHPLKVQVPRFFTELGITIEVRPELVKALTPMEVTEEGISICVNEVQLLKILPPMVVRPSGSVTELSLDQ